MAKFPATKNCTIKYSFNPSTCQGTPSVTFTESKLKVNGVATIFQINITMTVTDSATGATGVVPITLTPAGGTKLTVSSRELLVQGDKANGSASLTIPSPPGGTLPCTVTAEIQNAGQTKFKIN